MHAYSPLHLWPSRQGAPHYSQEYYHPAPQYPVQNANGDDPVVFPSKREASITPASAGIDSPVTPTDPGLYDMPSDRPFHPQYHSKQSLAQFTPYPTQQEYISLPPDHSPASEISDPWVYDQTPYADAPQYRYPHLGTRDTDAFDEHAPHLSMRRHALYPPRHDTPYRRPSLPPRPAPPVPAIAEHILTETHAIPQEELDNFFSTVGPSAGAGGRRAWVCQQCNKSVRKQDRAAHMLSHQGKKRYDCRCGKRFGRPQDADRHIREQAPCQTCEGKMGRYGKDGRCSTCVLELEHGTVN